MAEQQSLVPAKQQVALERPRRARTARGLGLGGSIAIGLVAGALHVLPLLVLAVPLLTLELALLDRHFKRFNADSIDGMAAITRGDLEHASTIFFSWASYSRNSRVVAAANHNLAWTYMRRGELEAAIAVHVANQQQRRQALQASGLSRIAAADLALDLALLGRLDQADSWLAKSDERTQPPQLASGPAMGTLVRAVIALRRNQADAAVRLLDDNFVAMEGSLQGENLRIVRVLRAFGRTCAGPREAGRAHEDIVVCRPNYPGEHRFLGVAWPEMEAFLATSGLAN